MDMVVCNDLVEMNLVESGEVSGGAINNLQIMYVSPDTSAIAQNTSIGGLYLPVGGAVVMLGVAAALACLNGWQ